MAEHRVSVTLERAALGAALVYPETVTGLRALLEPDHFSDPTHALLWRVLGQIDDEGIVPDSLTLAEELASTKRGEARCVTAVWIEGLRAYAPSSAEAAEGIARKVAGLAHARRVLQAAEQIQRMGQDPSIPLSRLCDEAPRLIEKATTRVEEQPLVGAVQLAEECFADLEKLRKEGRPKGQSTGLRDLDAYARLKPGEVWIVAGRPAMGKSAFAGRLLRSVAEQGKPALFFSLEMPRRLVFLRLACELAEVDSRVAESGQIDDRQMSALSHAMDTLSRLPLEIDDTADLTLFDLRTKTQRAKARLGELGIVLVDYLQLVKGSRSKTDNREQEIGEISRGSKVLAKQLETTVVMLSQLNRKCEERSDKRPLMSDLRESGAIEQDADVVLFLYRDEYYHKDSPDQGVAEAIVSKQRSGATGTVRLSFHAPLTRFGDLEQAEVVPITRPAKPARPARHMPPHDHDRAGGSND